MGVVALDSQRVLVRQSNVALPDTFADFDFAIVLVSGGGT
jgi:hypothetical protein